MNCSQCIYYICVLDYHMLLYSPHIFQSYISKYIWWILNLSLRNPFKFIVTDMLNVFKTNIPLLHIHYLYCKWHFACHSRTILKIFFYSQTSFNQLPIWLVIFIFPVYLKAISFLLSLCHHLNLNARFNSLNKPFIDNNSANIPPVHNFYTRQHQICLLVCILYHPRFYWEIPTVS